MDEQWGAPPRLFTAREAAHGKLHGKLSGAHSQSGQLKVIPFQAMEVHWGNNGKAPFILNLDAKWRRVVKFTSGRFTPGKETRCPVTSRMGGPQGLCGPFGNQINPFSCCRLKYIPSVDQAAAYSLYQLNYSHAPHNDVSVNDGPHIRRWSL